MDNTLRTPEEWESIKNVKIYDPAGWRGPNARSMAEPISEREWQWRMSMSTVFHVKPVEGGSNVDTSS